MIVSSSTMNPQNVAACAAPGMLHFSSFRCPITSLSCARRSPATWVRACWSRSGARLPPRTPAASATTNAAPPPPAQPPSAPGRQSAKPRATSVLDCFPPVQRGITTSASHSALIAQSTRCRHHSAPRTWTLSRCSCGRAVSSGFSRVDLLDELRDNGKQVADEAKVRDLEDRGLRILVDGDDGLGGRACRPGAGWHRRCLPRRTTGGRRSCRSGRPETGAGTSRRR